MKRMTMLLLAALAVALACPAQAETTAKEIIVFKENTEVSPFQLDMFEQIPSGTEYTVLRTLREADGDLPWSAAWVKHYVLQEIRYRSASSNAETTGWIASDTVSHPLSMQPDLLASRYIALTVPSREDTGQELTFAAISKQDEGQTAFTAAGAGDMAVSDALRVALDAVMEKYGETEGRLLRFAVSYGFRTEQEYFDAPYWQFDLRNDVCPMDGYEVMVHSPDGRVVYLCGPGEGNG